MGNDEYHRATIVFGWNVTGQMVVPLWHFKEDDCDPEYPCGPICEVCGRIAQGSVAKDGMVYFYKCTHGDYEDELELEDEPAYPDPQRKETE